MTDQDCNHDWEQKHENIKRCRKCGLAVIDVDKNAKFVMERE